jgi:hypothetical protein
MEPMEDPPAFDPRDFATTNWSLVLAARPDEASFSPRVGSPEPAPGRRTL